MNSNSVQLDAFALQFLLCNFNLLHKLRMCLRHVVECVDTPAKFEQEVCAKRDQGPERKLNADAVSGIPGLPRGLDEWRIHTTGTIWSWILGPKGTSCR